MAVKIRLKRMGKIRQPYYRVVVVDSRKKRDGRVIEEIGKYHPKQEPSFIEVDSERAQYWLGVGAQPTEAIEAILKVTGDWQKFKGLPGSEGTLRVAEPKRDKTEIFNEALKDSANEPKSEAVTQRSTQKSAAKKTAKKATSEAEPAEAPAAEAEPAAAEAPAAEAPAAEQTPAEEAPASDVEAAETPAATEEAPAEAAADETPAEAPAATDEA